MPDDTEVKLILSKIDDLSAYVKANFKELYEKHDAVLSEQSRYITQLTVLQTQFIDHKTDMVSSIKSQGERIGNLEKNPAMQNADRWKWLAAGLGLIYVALQAWGKIQEVMK